MAFYQRSTGRQQEPDNQFRADLPRNPRELGHENAETREDVSSRRRIGVLIAVVNGANPARERARTGCSTSSIRLVDRGLDNRPWLSTGFRQRKAALRASVEITSRRAGFRCNKSTTRACSGVRNAQVNDRETSRSEASLKESKSGAFHCRVNRGSKK
jgi:hypothetical protein